MFEYLKNIKTIGIFAKKMKKVFHGRFVLKITGKLIQNNIIVSIRTFTSIYDFEL